MATISVRKPASSSKPFLTESSFRTMLSFERKRTERSRKPFLLMLLDEGTDNLNNTVFQMIVTTLFRCTRDTDVAGWYEHHSVIGVIFTEITFTKKDEVLGTLLSRIKTALAKKLSSELLGKISISFHVFPEEWGDNTDDRQSNPAFYPDVFDQHQSYKAKRLLKRLVDIGGSLLALVILSPLFLIIAIAVRLSSEGQVLFRQSRVGQYGVPFNLLKFRSMRANNDVTIHKEYVTQLVSGRAPKQRANGQGDGVYKLTDDPRITRVGALLRRSSLDELPQFLNVLKGDMSLVGPRPPVPYEVDLYDLWHRRRLLEAKPGITGLWQVSGRNRIAFDDMVRLDLLYTKRWSLWLDLKILLRTPFAVIEGAH